MNLLIVLIVLLLFLRDILKTQSNLDIIEAQPSWGPGDPWLSRCCNSSITRPQRDDGSQACHGINIYTMTLW